METWLRMTPDQIPHPHVRFQRAFRFTIPALFLAVALANEARGQVEREDPCTLSDADAQWIQKALDGWERVSVDVLELDPLPLPWMVLFNQTCAWHLAPDTSRLPDAEAPGVGLTFAGRRVPVSVKRHDDDALWLPSGSMRPVEATAFASAYESGSEEPAPFFVLALLDVWRENPNAGQDSDLETIMLGVATHEIVHTRQVAEVARRIEELKVRYTMPERISDTMIEDRFKGVSGFRDAYERETDLLYGATSEHDPDRKRALVNEALDVIRARQAEYFTGPDAVYRELEELFLNMEGVAVWAAYRLSQLDPAYDVGIEDPATDRARNTWAQDQGLVAFLLIDDLVPDWRERVLGPELASPYRLLEEALSQR